MGYKDRDTEFLLQIRGTFNSLYGIRLPEITVSFSFIYNFQFPLWDTLIAFCPPNYVYFCFQFPLWDTGLPSRSSEVIPQIFQFPLWDTMLIYQNMVYCISSFNSLYGIQM